jgi:hypothetical protein
VTSTSKDDIVDRIAARLHSQRLEFTDELLLREAARHIVSLRRAVRLMALADGTAHAWDIMIGRTQHPKEWECTSKRSSDTSKPQKQAPASRARVSKRKSRRK